MVPSALFSWVVCPPAKIRVVPGVVLAFSHALTVASGPFKIATWLAGFFSAADLAAAHLLLVSVAPGRKITKSSSPSGSIFPSGSFWTYEYRFHRCGDARCFFEKLMGSGLIQRPNAFA